VSAREEILARVRRASRDAPAVDVTRSYDGPGRTGVDLDLFVERLRDYRATVHECLVADIAATVARCLGAERAVISPPGLDASWLDEADVDLMYDVDPLDVGALDKADAVVTSCALGIAETATIVLDHGPGQGRRALTLVPDHHIVVVRAAQVVATVPDAIAALRPGVVQTWISGPSATSDIELNRVEGVHGPRRLDVVLVRLIVAGTGRAAPR
jgi:L-lactate dehydrogenase complex protein LldG